jgi:hypothetical protein
MSGFNFNVLMSPDEIDLAHKASAIAASHLKGEKLHESLMVGEAILVGRKAAMEAVNTNTANGYHYSKAFTAWKAQFGFASVPKPFLDQCMICAQHRTIADEIIAALKPIQRANLGINGLAKRVRDKLAAIAGEAKRAAARVNPITALKEKLADTTHALANAEEKLAAIDDDPPPFVWSGPKADTIKNIVAVMIDTPKSRARAESLYKELGAALGHKPRRVGK